MLRSSSSTSSSEPIHFRRRFGHARLRRRVFGVLSWTLAASILIDVAVGFAFRLPADPRSAGSALQNYFNYGRSIEGKLRRLVGKTPDGDAPIVRAGWLPGECDIESPPLPGNLSF